MPEYEPEDFLRELQTESGGPVEEIPSAASVASRAEHLRAAAKGAADALGTRPIVGVQPMHPRLRADGAVKKEGK